MQALKLSRFDADDLLRTLISLCRPCFDLPRDPWEACVRIADFCLERLPFGLANAFLYEDRVNVMPAILNPKTRNALTESMLCSPGQVFIIRDPMLPADKGVYMAMAGPDLETIAKWVKLAMPLHMMLGEYRNVRLMAAQLRSFI